MDVNYFGVWSDSANPRVFCKERKKSARSLRPLTWRYVLKKLKSSEAKKIKRKINI
jgi:hypothetical protein